MAVPGGIPRWDPEGPSAARIHNYLTGGGNWGSADEAAAREVLGICPQARRIARVSRLFSARAARYAASRGITQIIDLGCGVPRTARESLHEIAGTAGRPVRAAYVDLDEMALADADVILGGHDGVALVRQDLRDPGAVLADPGLGKVIGLDEPVLVIAALVLQFQAAGDAREVTAGYMSRVVPGSLLAVSVPRFGDRGVLAALNEAYAPAVLHGFADDEVAGLFRPGGNPRGWLSLVPPGIRPAAGLQPGWGTCRNGPPAGAYVIGGIGRKP